MMNKLPKIALMIGVVLLICPSLIFAEKVEISELRDFVSAYVDSISIWGRGITKISSWPHNAQNEMIRAINYDLMAYKTALVGYCHFLDCYTECDSCTACIEGLTESLYDMEVARYEAVGVLANKSDLRTSNKLRGPSNIVLIMHEIIGILKDYGPAPVREHATGDINLNLWYESINRIPISVKQKSPQELRKRQFIVHPVTSIIDGNTFVLKDSTRVRLIGVDAPEKGGPYADSAISYLSSLILGKNVSMEYDNRQKDSSGRTLAYIYIDDLCVNEDLLKRGLACAKVGSMYRYRQRYIFLSCQACSEDRGLWKSYNR